jgi:hypothetical protein
MPRDWRRGLQRSDVNDFDNRADHVNAAEVGPRFYDS